jgi:hypothetical protein
VADVVRWHLEHVGYVQQLLSYHPVRDVDADLRYELGLGLLVRLEIEAPGLFAAAKPKGVG